MASSSEHDDLYRLRHSLAHVMAQAVLELRPGSRLAFGPPIDNGCYYDFDLTSPLSEDDFPEVTKRMRRIIQERQPFTQSMRTAEEARAYLVERGEDYKVEYCDELFSTGEKEIGFFTNGTFEDMCRGPHVEHTGQIPPDCFQIDSVAGAYWRGDEKRPQLTRLYCLAFRKKSELEDYLRLRQLAEERDHRRLGTLLDLFSINHEEVGSGLILWHPKGAKVRHLIEEHCKERHIQGGYDFVYTPHIGRATLWQTSGHLDFYKEGMFPPIDIENQPYYLKPMNCPFHCHIFKTSLRSYKEMPFRFAEWGTVYRFERSGTMHGLTRVRGFTQDDAHLFCRADQMPAEIDRVLHFCLGLLRDFGFTAFKMYLSTRPPERVGEDSQWDEAEAALLAALERGGLPFELNEGDGAFYGPKIDICLTDALGRQWQISTIQFDFNLPERFDLTYIGSDGQKHRPFMIHRALLGSMERFFGVLVEHLNGAFPTWLAPLQLRIVAVNPQCLEYAQSLAARLTAAGYRVDIDDGADSFNKKVRNAITSKIPNIAIIGGREVEGGTVTLRRYGVETQQSLTLAELEELLRQENLRPSHTIESGSESPHAAVG